MITRIEIDGFKSFKDFSVDLAPLTVIAGPNASGKSNLFDALRLLSGLARGEQFPFGLHGRGLPDDLFTKYDQEESTDRMTLAIEMLLPTINTSGGANGSAQVFPRMRYEVDISRYTKAGFTSYPITRELLVPISLDTDEWSARYAPWINANTNGAKLDYSSTVISHQRNPAEQHNDWKEDASSPYEKNIPDFALLSMAHRAGDPNVFAVREELSKLHLLDLNAPTNFTNYDQRNPNNDPKQTLNILVNIKKRQPEYFQFLSTQLNQIVSGLGKIDLYTDELNRSTVTVTDRQGRRFPFESLSEGTLRIIALAARLVENDMRHILLLEEPENGIDPLRLENLVQLLVGLSARLDASGQDLRQIICTTHSPVLLKALLKNEHALVVFCSQPTYLFNDEKGIRRSVSITRMTPLQLDARTNVNAGRIEKITLLQALNYFKELTIDVSEFESSVHA